MHKKTDMKFLMIFLFSISVDTSVSIQRMSSPKTELENVTKDETRSLGKDIDGIKLAIGLAFE
jgi:hypothetical protein